MVKRMILLSVVIGLCLGVSCTIIPDGVLPGTSTPLDKANATITITEAPGATSADVAADIADSAGRTVLMTTGQAVSVNGMMLTGPDAVGEYTASVPMTDTYAIRVQEPTRGVQTTAIDAPATFVITAPAAGGAAPLSGFTLQWSNANDRLQVEIRIAQVVLGDTSSQKYGPFTDTGTRQFLAADLVPYFVQGADLTITVTRFSQTPVAGFSSGTASVRVSASETVVPRP